MNLVLKIMAPDVINLFLECLCLYFTHPPFRVSIIMSGGQNSKKRHFFDVSHYLFPCSSM